MGLTVMVPLSLKGEVSIKLPHIFGDMFYLSIYSICTFYIIGCKGYGTDEQVLQHAPTTDPFHIDCIGLGI